MIFICGLCSHEGKAEEFQVGTYPIALICADSEACIDRMVETQKQKITNKEN